MSLTVIYILDWGRFYVYQLIHSIKNVVLVLIFIRRRYQSSSLASHLSGKQANEMNGITSFVTWVEYSWDVDRVRIYLILYNVKRILQNLFDNQINRKPQNGCMFEAQNLIIPFDEMSSHLASLFMCFILFCSRSGDLNYHHSNWSDIARDRTINVIV